MSHTASPVFQRIALRVWPMTPPASSLDRSFARRRWRRVRLALSTLVGTFLLAAPAASADEWIELTNNGFYPEQVTVDAGTTLHFSNRTSSGWSVTSDSGLFDSKALGAKGAYSMTVSVPNRCTASAWAAAVSSPWPVVPT